MVAESFKKQLQSIFSRKKDVQKERQQLQLILQPLPTDSIKFVLL